MSPSIASRRSTSCQQRSLRDTDDGGYCEPGGLRSDFRGQCSCATHAGAPCHRVAAKRRGVIINIGSINAFMGEPRLLVYAASKAALVRPRHGISRIILSSTAFACYCLNFGWMDSEGERAMMTQLGHPADFIERAGQGMAARANPEAGRSRGGRALPGLRKGAPFSGQVIELEQFPTGTLSAPQKAGLT